MVLKTLTKSSDLKVGHFIAEFATPGIGHIVNAAGCDCALLDMQHSGFTFETAKNVIRAGCKS